MPITITPIQDGYDVTLTQALDAATGAGGYIYVSATPTATIPANETTSVRIDTGNSRAEEIEIDQIDAVNKRLRIKTRNLTQGNGMTTTAQTHPGGANCIITFSYAQHRAIKDELTTLYTPGRTFADDAAADAAWPGGTAPNGVFFYSTAAGSMRYKESGVWTGGPGSTDWAQTRSVAAASAFTGEFVRASDDSNNLHFKFDGFGDKKLMIAATGKLDTGVYDFASQAEAEAGTEATKPLTSQRVAQAITAQVPTASDTVAGKAERAIDAEVTTGTDTTRFTTPAQMRTYTYGLCSYVSVSRAANNGTQWTVAHGLGVTPKYVRVSYSILSGSGAGFYKVGTGHAGHGSVNGTAADSQGFLTYKGATTAYSNYVPSSINATNLVLDYGSSGTAPTGTAYHVFEFFA